MPRTSRVPAAVIGRRSLLTGAAGLAATGLLAGCGGAGAQPGAGAPLRAAAIGNVVAEAVLAGLRTPQGVPGVGRAEFVPLATPDALRTALTSGQLDMAVLPTTAAANLARRGIDVRLAGVIDYPVLTVVAPASAPAGWDGLRGRTIATAFRGDVTDVLLRLLMKANGLAPDRDVLFSYAPQLDSVAADLVAGRAEAAVLPDVATARVLAATAGRLAPRVDVAQQWRAWTGSTLSSVSLALRGEVVDAAPDLLPALRAHATSAAAAAGPDSPVVGPVAAVTRNPEPVVRAVLAGARPSFRPGPAARPDIEVLLDRVLAESPQLVGGGRPDDRFYG